MERRNGGLKAAKIVLPERPLISVVMTTFNSAEHVEAAAKSILAQTYKDVELIVVDDASTDKTCDLIRELEKKDRRMRLIQLSRNRGTYWAKNVGIIAASGEVITFQDSDDWSDPNRLQGQLQALRAQPDFVASTCSYVRINNRGEVVPNRGLVEREALISLMLKRQVFADIGYFDTVRSSADAEFICRLKLTYKKERAIYIREPLYFARAREGSLTNQDGNAVNFSAGPHDSFLPTPRLQYQTSFHKWHAAVKAAGARPFVPFPVTNRPFDVDVHLAVEGTRFKSQPVIAFMATYPPRLNQLRQAVKTLLPQVDLLYIYMNNYSKIPDFLRHDRIVVAQGRHLEDLRDNGKFYHMAEAPQGYYFTVDDDIFYPANYCDVLIRKIEEFDRKVIVGVHGIILAQPLERYSAGRTVLKYNEALEADAKVNILGSGTLAFHSSTIKIDVNRFSSKGMADIWLAVLAKKASVDMIAVSRPEAWLRPLPSDHPSATLYDEMKSDDTKHTSLLRAQGAWGL